MSRRVGSLVLVMTACAACSGQRARGVISGDVYFAGADGEGKRASGVAVQLLNEPDSINARLTRICADHARTMLALKTRLTDGLQIATAFGDGREGLRRLIAATPVIEARQDSVRMLTLRMMDRVRAAVSAALADSVTTRFDAHYRFAHVRPGSYFLYSHGQIVTKPHIWLERVKVANHDSTIADLGIKDELTTMPFYCEMSVADLAGATSHTDASILKQRLAQLDSMDSSAARSRRAEAARVQAEAARERANEVAVQQAKERDAVAAASVRSAAAAYDSLVRNAFDPSQLDVRPKMISGLGADGRAPTSNAGLGGTAMVRFVVRSDGGIGGIFVESMTDPHLADEARKVIASRRYSPGMKAGRTVAVRMGQLLIFP